jgi:hypothetical protein
MSSKLEPGVLVVNEWVFHDLKGENGESCRVAAVEFLERLVARCQHQLAAPEPGPWLEKAYDLMRQPDPLTRLASRRLWGVLNDSRKCVRCNVEECPPLPDNLQTRVPADDVYLVQAALALEAVALVTTDARLKSCLEEIGNPHRLTVILREVFLREYCA